MPPVKLWLTPRARKDLADCMAYIQSQTWGRPHLRLFEIMQALQQLRWVPERRRVERYLRSGIELRRTCAAQFVIIYCYFKPKSPIQRGLISVRAIRHRRVRDVFNGVRSPSPDGDVGYQT